MVVDVVQRELGTDVFVECGPVLQVYTSAWGLARTCNADHVECFGK